MNMVMAGKLSIYTYLPWQMLPEAVDELAMDEFLRLYGQAESARDMHIKDIEFGVAQALAAIINQLQN